MGSNDANLAASRSTDIASSSEAATDALVCHLPRAYAHLSQPALVAGSGRADGHSRHRRVCEAARRMERESAPHG